VKIGSRGSALAVAQADLVRTAFANTGTPTAIVTIETDGDRRAPDTSWGEGAFVTAIERALRDGEIDVAVHSAKDVPTDEDSRLTISAYLPRGDPRDALVVAAPDALTVDELPAGCRLGTDSPRRSGFLRAHRPDLRFVAIHGNVDTRLRRLDAGEVDALVLAAAGLDRLGLAHRITQRLDPAIVPPAPGQGAIAVQVRTEDTATHAIASAMDDAPTRTAVEAEREFLRAAGGGCRSPLGALASTQDGAFELLAGYASTDGARAFVAERRGDPRDSVEFARELANEVVSQAQQHRRHAGGNTRVVITRPADQASELLAALRDVALDPVVVPAIEVASRSNGRELQRAARLLHTYDWVVVTSTNGANAILEAAVRVLTNLDAPAWAAIGGATRETLEREGIDIEFQPAEPSSRSLAATLPLAAGQRVLIIRSDIAGDRLANALRARGADVDDVVGYQTREAPRASRPLLRAAFRDGPPAAIVFTSASTVRGLQKLAADEFIEIAELSAVCIGTQTATAARDAGLRVVAVAGEPRATSIAQATAAALTTELQEAR
jgi:hydroxymethylbilane synthase